jgi:ADP-ribosylglycohydrolase
MMRKFYLWIREAIWTATDEVFDVGITTRNAIINYQNGNSAVNCGLQDEYSNGNGSLMRILPVSFAVLKLPMERRKEICFNVSALTHAHFRSKIACWLYSEIIRNLVDDLSKNKSIDDAFNLVELWCEANYAQSEFRHFRRCNSSIESYKSDQIKSTGYVLDSLEAALYAFLNTKNYKEAVLMAVNLGEDTDTIGLITGGLAGTYYGYNEIPTDWINAILKKEKILQLIDNFYEKYKF